MSYRLLEIFSGEYSERFLDTAMLRTVIIFFSENSERSYRLLATIIPPDIDKYISTSSYIHILNEESVASRPSNKFHIRMTQYHEGLGFLRMRRIQTRKAKRCN